MSDLQAETLISPLLLLKEKEIIFTKKVNFSSIRFDQSEEKFIQQLLRSFSVLYLIAW